MAALNDIFSNRILIISFISWITAQVLKVIIVFLKEKKIDFKRLIGAGGMPSSHSAFVVALSVSVGRTSGFNSLEFAICTVFALIVMYDAAGVRRAAGKQARVLNSIIEDMQLTGKVAEERLKELIGHTPVEVFAGAILGIIIAAIL